MRFLYKIHSGYDGFRPSVIPERMTDGRLVLGGWRHYIDAVEKGWECWVFFRGPHNFEDGVYVKGIVDAVDIARRQVRLRVREHDTDAPLTSPETSARVAEAVSTRYRQVFVWPEDWTVAPDCGLAACADRRCDDCQTWDELPLIEPEHARAPGRLRSTVCEHLVPGHWIVPRRCYETRIAARVRELTTRFTAFKLGEMAYAYPFALAMFEQLRRRDLLQFDYVVPIPLSPDKARSGEVHRTRKLAAELGRLLAVPVREMLRLTEPVAKRRMQQLPGYTPYRFERKYREALRATVPDNARSVLLVDDVITRGSTVSQAIAAIREQRPDTEVAVATAGQMILKESVVDDSAFKA